MSASKLALLTLAIAYVEARFGQEGLVQADIAALDAFGEPGAAATLAGQTPGVLLGGAGPCDKLMLADQIVQELGDDPEVIAGAASLVAAEKNFNPFDGAASLCADPELPATEALRGILPLVDPAVEGADVQNANSAASLETPFNAEGLSEAEIAIEQGFTNFVAQDADGNEVTIAGLQEGGGVVSDDAQAGTATEDAEEEADDDLNQGQGNQEAGNANDQSQNDNQDNQGVDDEEDEAGGGAAGGAADFGDCDPTLIFEGGLNGRPADEFTFQSADPTIAANQQEALNPDIIVNRICDELGNTCGANDVAIQACLDAQQDLIDRGLGVDADGEEVLEAFNSAILAA